MLNSFTMVNDLSTALELGDSIRVEDIISDTPEEMDVQEDDEMEETTSTRSNLIEALSRSVMSVSLPFTPSRTSTVLPTSSSREVEQVLSTSSSRKVLRLVFVPSTGVEMIKDIRKKRKTKKKM